MADPAHVIETVGVESPHAEQGGPLSPDATMVMWTWVTFALLALILYKTAWKPILAALDKREEDIRKSVDNTEQARAELERIQQRESEIIAEADKQAKEIITTARTAATEVARVVEHKAKEESRILIENAEREIKTASKKAQSDLRRESANLAVSLSSKILREKLDDATARELTDRLIKEV